MALSADLVIKPFALCESEQGLGPTGMGWTIMADGAAKEKGDRSVNTL